MYIDSDQPYHMKGFRAMKGFIADKLYGWYVRMEWLTTAHSVLFIAGRL